MFKRFQPPFKTMTLGGALFFPTGSRKIFQILIMGRDKSISIALPDTDPINKIACRKRRKVILPSAMPHPEVTTCPLKGLL